MKRVITAGGILLSACIMAADPAIKTVKPTRTIGDSRFRVGDDIPRIRMSPDGKAVISCCNDGTIRWWDAKTKKEIKRWEPKKTASLWDFEILPGNRMLVASSADKVSLVDLKTGKVLKTYPHPSSVYRIELAKDKRRFLACGDFKEVILWDIETGKKKRTFKGHQKDVYSTVLSHDGSLLYTCGEDKTWRAWSAETGKEQWQKNPGANDLYVLEQHPTQKWMAISSSKNSVWVVDLGTGNTLWNAGIGKKVQSVAWSPDGTRIAANGDVLAVMDAKTGDKVMSTKLPEGYNWGICWAPDGKRLYTTSSNVLLEYEVATGKRLFPATDTEVITGGVDMPRCVSSSGVIYFKGEGKGVNRLDGTTGKRLKPLLTKKYLNCLEISPDGTLLACGSSDGTTRMLKTKDGSVLFEKKENDYGLEALRFSPDGTHLFVGSQDKVYMYRAKDGSRLRTFSRKDAETVGKKKKAPEPADIFEDDVQRVDFDWGGMDPDSPDVEDLSLSPDGRSMAVAYDDNAVLLWRVADASIAETIRGDADKASVKRCLLVQAEQLTLVMYGRESKKETLFAVWETPVPPALKMAKEEIAALIARLGAESFRDRRKATKSLTAQGAGIVPHLRAFKTEDPEITFRINDILKKIDKANGMKRLPLAAKKVNVLGIAPTSSGKGWLATVGNQEQRYLARMTVDGKTLVTTARFAATEALGSLFNAPSGEVIIGNPNGTVSIFAASKKSASK